MKLRQVIAINRKPDPATLQCDGGNISNRWLRFCDRAGLRTKREHSREVVLCNVWLLLLMESPHGSGAWFSHHHAKAAGSLKQRLFLRALSNGQVGHAV